MVYYAVVSTYDDEGHVTANIVGSIDTEYPPENSYKSYRRKDVYTDWFKTKEDAQAFAESAEYA